MPLLVRRPRLCSSLYSSDHSVGLGWRAKDLKCLPSFLTAALWKVEVFLPRFSCFIYLGPFFSSFEKKHHVVVWCECGHAHARHRVRAEVRQQLWAWVFPPWDGVSCSVSHTKLSGIADMGSHTRLHVILGVWDQGIVIAGRVYSRSHLPSPLFFLRWELCYAAQAGFELAVILLLLPPAYGSICRSVSLHLALLFFCQRVSTLQMELRVGWDREKLSCNARSWLLGFGSLGFPCSCFGAMFYVNFGWFHIPGMF